MSSTTKIPDTKDAAAIVVTRDDLVNTTATSNREWLLQLENINNINNNSSANNNIINNRRQGPFESFITVAISTILTVLLAWRILLLDDDRGVFRRKRREKQLCIADSATTTTVRDRRSSSLPAAPARNTNNGYKTSTMENCEMSVTASRSKSIPRLTEEQVYGANDKQNCNQSSATTMPVTIDVCGSMKKQTLQSTLKEQQEEFLSGESIVKTLKRTVVDSSHDKDLFTELTTQRSSNETTKAALVDFGEENEVVCSSSIKKLHSPGSNFNNGSLHVRDSNNNRSNNFSFVFDDDATSLAAAQRQEIFNNESDIDTTSAYSATSLASNFGSDEAATKAVATANRSSTSREFSATTPAIIMDGYESDISFSDAGVPPYLDTITEEDTDDLNSISSGEDSARSSKSRNAQDNNDKLRRSGSNNSKLFLLPQQQDLVNNTVSSLIPVPVSKSSTNSNSKSAITNLSCFGFKNVQHTSVRSSSRPLILAGPADRASSAGAYSSCSAEQCLGPESSVDVGDQEMQEKYRYSPEESPAEDADNSICHKQHSFVNISAAANQVSAAASETANQKRLFLNDSSLNDHSCSSSSSSTSSSSSKSSKTTDSTPSAHQNNGSIISPQAEQFSQLLRTTLPDGLEERLLLLQRNGTAVTAPVETGDSRFHQAYHSYKVAVSGLSEPPSSSSETENSFIMELDLDRVVKKIKSYAATYSDATQSGIDQDYDESVQKELNGFIEPESNGLNNGNGIVPILGSSSKSDTFAPTTNSSHLKLSNGNANALEQKKNGQVNMQQEAEAIDVLYFTASTPPHTTKQQQNGVVPSNTTQLLERNNTSSISRECLSPEENGRTTSFRILTQKSAQFSVTSKLNGNHQQFYHQNTASRPGNDQMSQGKNGGTGTTIVDQLQSGLHNSLPSASTLVLNGNKFSGSAAAAAVSTQDIASDNDNSSSEGSTLTSADIFANAEDTCVEQPLSSCAPNSAESSPKKKQTTKPKTTVENSNSSNSSHSNFGGVENSPLTSSLQNSTALLRNSKSSNSDLCCSSLASTSGSGLSNTTTTVQTTNCDSSATALQSHDEIDAIFPANNAAATTTTTSATESNNRNAQNSSNAAAISTAQRSSSSLSFDPHKQFLVAVSYSSSVIQQQNSLLQSSLPAASSTNSFLSRNFQQKTEAESIAATMNNNQQPATTAASTKSSATRCRACLQPEKCLCHPTTTISSSDNKFLSRSTNAKHLSYSSYAASPMTNNATTNASALAKTTTANANTFSKATTEVSDANKSSALGQRRSAAIQSVSTQAVNSPLIAVDVRTTSKSNGRGSTSFLKPHRHSRSALTLDTTQHTPSGGRQPIVSPASSKPSTATATANATSKNPYVALAKATATAASKAASCCDITEDTDEIALTVSASIKIRPSDILRNSNPLSSDSSSSVSSSASLPEEQNQKNEVVMTAARPVVYPMEHSYSRGAERRSEHFRDTDVERPGFRRTTDVTKTEEYLHSTEITRSSSSWATPARNIPWGTASIIKSGEQATAIEEVLPSRQTVVHHQPAATKYSVPETGTRFSPAKSVSTTFASASVPVKVSSSFQPEAERISPPKQVASQFEVEKRTIPHHMAHQFLSSEHIQKLLEDPYYVKAKSRETVFPPSEPKQTFQKERPLPLTESNVRNWSTLPENAPNQQQHLMRWRNSMNLEEIDQLIVEEEAAAAAQAARDLRGPIVPAGRGGPTTACGAATPDSLATSGTSQKELQGILKFRRPEQIPVDDSSETDSRKLRRSNRYKNKIEKAKKEFLQDSGEQQKKGSATDLYRPSEEFERKFQVSMENVLRKPEPPRGPLLEQFHSPKFKSNIDLSDLKLTFVPPAPLWDEEYNKIVQNAEKLWSAYKKRVTPPKESMYSHPRSFSTGYLETDIDTGREKQVISGKIEVPETDMDEVHRSRPQQLPVATTTSDHNSRSRTRSVASMRERSEEHVKEHSRARSMDFISDKNVSRDELEIPENQLKKILGTDEKQLSEHELRFKKSLEKLHIPDWYLFSETAGQKLDFDAVANRSRRSTPYGYRVSGTDASYPTSPEPMPPPETPPHYSQKTRQTLTTSSSYYSQEQSSTSIRTERSTATPMEPLPEPPSLSYQVRQQPEFVTPSYPRQPAPRPSILKYQDRTQAAEPTPAPPSVVNSPQPKLAASVSSNGSSMASEVYLPRNFFTKYKDEIEDLRRTREQQPQFVDDFGATTSVSLPVAHVRPQQQQAAFSEDLSSSFSDQVIPSPVPVVNRVVSSNLPTRQFAVVLQSPPLAITNLQGYTSPAPSTATEDFGQGPLLTSSPYPSDQMERRHAPPALPPKVTSPDKPSPATRLYYPKPAPPVSYSNDATAPPPLPPRVISQASDAVPAKKARDSTYSTHSSEADDVPLPLKRIYAGWTVAAPTLADMDEPRSRNSRVIEVADTFFDTVIDSSGNRVLASHATLEEVLDNLLALQSRGAGGQHLSVLEDTSGRNLDLRPQTPTSIAAAKDNSGMAVFVQEPALMQKCLKAPQLAENLLRGQRLWVRCQYCGKVRDKTQAQSRYVTCKNCYTYYCSRVCRRSDWNFHRENCNFARINTLCKEVIIKVRSDVEAQWQMSRVARQGYATRGRGSVNFRFRSPRLAEVYVEDGWNDLQRYPGNYLYYFTIQDLIDGGKDRNLISLCRRYDPRGKFILSVSVITDIDECPETPQPEKASIGAPSIRSSTHSYLSEQQTQQDSWYRAPGKQQKVVSNVDDEDPLLKYNYRPYRTPEPQATTSAGAPPLLFNRTSSLPPERRQPRPVTAVEPSTLADAKTILKSVLRSVENIAPGDVIVQTKETRSGGNNDSNLFARDAQSRHSTGSTPRARSAPYAYVRGTVNEQQQHRDDPGIMSVKVQQGRYAMDDDNVAESEV